MKRIIFIVVGIIATGSVIYAVASSKKTTKTDKVNTANNPTPPTTPPPTPTPTPIKPQFTDKRGIKYDKDYNDTTVLPVRYNEYEVNLNATRYSFLIETRGYEDVFTEKKGITLGIDDYADVIGFLFTGEPVRFTAEEIIGLRYYV